MASSGSSTQLPPRPDPTTGQPSPPAAPTHFPEGYNEKRPSRAPAAPEGRGPALTQYRQKRQLSWLGGFIPVVLLTACFLVYDGLKGLALWPIWLILAAVYAWTVFVHRANMVSAGADWVRGGRKHWVATYELTRIHLRPYGTTAPGLFLVDKDEHSVEISLDLLQANRAVWNYVHLGLRHSAANGANLNIAGLSRFPELAEDSNLAVHRVGRRHHDED